MQLWWLKDLSTAGHCKHGRIKMMSTNNIISQKLNREVLDAQTFRIHIEGDVSNMHVQKLACFPPALYYPSFPSMSLQTLSSEFMGPRRSEFKLLPAGLLSDSDADEAWTSALSVDGTESCLSLHFNPICQTCSWETSHPYSSPFGEETWLENQKWTLCKT